MSQRTQYALVTGCGKGGIGEALAVEYQRKGLHAIATVLPSESSQHLTDAGITWFPLDVTQEDSIKTLKEKIIKLTGGNLDVLVNNAGICYTMTAIDTDIKPVQKMFDVNVFGPMRMVHHFHDMLIRSQGAVVNIGSIGGVIPYVYGSSYNATKAALAHWSSTLRVEMKPLGVRVVTVISGEVGTNILKADASREIPKGSYYSPLAEDFKKHVQRTPDTMDRFIYARNVVAESVKASPAAWFWFGNATWFVWILETFTPRTTWDRIFWNWFNFSKLRDTHQQIKRD